MLCGVRFSMAPIIPDRRREKSEMGVHFPLATSGKWAYIYLHQAGAGADVNGREKMGKYSVSTITTTAAGVVTTTEIGRYAAKEEAMRVAKRAARTTSDCEVYGPSALCYVGRRSGITVVVAWA